MSNPYAKLGGGALDQELFKKKQNTESVKDGIKAINQNKENLSSTTPSSKPIKRKQISAYLTSEQLQKLKSLHYFLNRNLLSDGEIEKSDIVALGIEILSLFLGTQVPEYSNSQDLKKIVLDRVSKYLSTQVPES